MLKEFTSPLILYSPIFLVVICRKAPQNVTVTEGELVNITVICSGEYEFDFTLFLSTMDGTAVGECANQYTCVSTYSFKLDKVNCATIV